MSNSKEWTQGTDAGSAFPWVPVLRLAALGTSVAAAMVMGRWSDSLGVAVMLCVLPVALHVALVLPHPQPLTAKHPYVFGWIYGISALAPAAWLLTWSLAPIMGSKIGMNVGFLLQDHFRSISDEARTGIALLCLAVVLAIVVNCAMAIRSQGWSAAVLGRPRRTIATLLLVPGCSAIAIVGGCSLLRAPEAVLEAAALVVHTVLYSEALAARSVIFVGFPLAICFSLLRGRRTPRWQA